MKQAPGHEPLTKPLGLLDNRALLTLTSNKQWPLAPVLLHSRSVHEPGRSFKALHLVLLRADKALPRWEMDLKTEGDLSAQQPAHLLHHSDSALPSDEELALYPFRVELIRSLLQPPSTCFV